MDICLTFVAEKINNGVLIEKDGKSLVNKKNLSGFNKHAMNKKLSKINEKTYKDFEKVLYTKNYNEIRIQDILDQSALRVARFTLIIGPKKTC